LSVSTPGAETYAGSITGTSGGLTTTGSGTLTLTGHVSTPGGALDVKQGTLAVGTGGAVIVGSLIQSAGSTLSLAPGADAPIQVSGAVQLGGTLAVTSVPQVPAGGKIVLIHGSGAKAVSGTFSGLPQGAKVSVGGREFTIDYAGDSGHDVVLAAGGGSPSAIALASGSAAAAAGARAGSNDVGTGGGSSLEIAGATGVAAAAVAGGGILLMKRRKRGALAAAGAGDAPQAMEIPAVQGRHRHRKK
jgi:autotransporter-associated beta strand protein